jgi:hypothetical protein
MRHLGWGNPKVPVVQLANDPAMLATGLWMAREVGDNKTWERLRAVAESEYEPRYFGEDNSRFAFFCGLGEQWPRGQMNAQMMMIECAEPNAWSRVFNSPNTTMYNEPSLLGVDYPNLGIRLARNDMERRELEVITTAATPSMRGIPTEFIVEKLPSNQVKVIVDGHESQHWRELAPGVITINIDIDTHHIRVAF